MKKIKKSIIMNKKDTVLYNLAKIISIFMSIMYMGLPNLIFQETSPDVRDVALYKRKVHKPSLFLCSSNIGCCRDKMRHISPT